MPRRFMSTRMASTFWEAWKGVLKTLGRCSTGFTISSAEPMEKTGTRDSRMVCMAARVVGEVPGPTMATTPCCTSRRVSTAASVGSERLSTMISSTGRPRMPPSLFTFSCQRVAARA